MPLVKFFLIILAPVAVPLAKVLDYFLEEDVGTVHTKNEMMHYLKLHAKRGGLDNESGLVMRGALEMKEKRVREVMTPLEDVYMLPESTRLSFKVVREIFEQGFSRVPVFRGERQRIVGLLFVKDLIFVDPEDETALTSLLGIFASGLQIVDETDSLDDVLRIFKAGHGHLALVRRGEVTKKLSAIQEDSNESKEVELTEMGAPPVPDQAPSVFVGIVTLEDIVEEILGDEIIDETDVFVDVDNHVKVAGRSDFDFTKLRRLDAEFVDERQSGGGASGHFPSTHEREGFATFDNSGSRRDGSISKKIKGRGDKKKKQEPAFRQDPRAGSHICAGRSGFLRYARVEWQAQCPSGRRWVQSRGRALDCARGGRPCVG